MKSGTAYHQESKDSIEIRNIRIRELHQKQNLTVRQLCERFQLSHGMITKIVTEVD